MATPKEKPVYTQPRTQVDLEARMADDAEPAISVVLNPNPFGEEDYAGTDPIYQNHANDTEKPLRSTKGAEKKAEDQVREAYKAGKNDEEVDDPGMGGKAVRVTGQTAAAEDSEKEDESGKDEGQGGEPTKPPSPPSPPAPTK